MTDNPLLTALPPETDYISYLTILEYNLNPEQLPTLHEILQDTTLTANIGWDLVHLLLPLLPASQICLQDVARLGNPREVVLKVTELLEAIGTEDRDEDEDEDQAEDDETEEVAGRVESLDIKDGEARGKEGDELVHPAFRSQGPQEAFKPPSKVTRFITLVQMLSILHPRIKTKYPSRFLSTSLQAILPAFMQVVRHLEATEAVLGFIKELSGTKRPRLPPRKSSLSMLTQSAGNSAPDPEGKDEAMGADETALQTRLLQSFLTFVTEGYMISMAVDEDIPGLAWSSRYQEKLHPEKVIPGRGTYSDLFAKEESLHERDTVIGQILALSKDLKIKTEELLHGITKPDEEDDDKEMELPSHSNDVPLSRTGSIYLLSAMAASSALFDAPTALPSVALIPDFAAILATSLGDSATGSTGAEPEPLIDAVLFLGFLVINSGQAIPTDNDTAYNNILQRLSLLSANMPSPALRYHAHVLTCSILHAHPSDQVRLAFIQDTLEHCPYENLKASAVGWLKDEILAADKNGQEKKESKAIIFSTPATLTTLGSFLCPNPDTLMQGQSISDSYATFQAYEAFYLAVLNLVYLLLSSPRLLSGLHIATVVQEWHFPHLLSALHRAANDFRDSIEKGDLSYGDGEIKGARLVSMDLMVMSVLEVREAAEKARIPI